MKARDLFIILLTTGCVLANDLAAQVTFERRNGFGPEAGISRFIIAKDGGIYGWSQSTLSHSTDDGRSWSTVHTFPMTIADLQQAPNGTLYAITNSEVIRSEDKGATWMSFDSISRAAQSFFQVEDDILIIGNYLQQSYFTIDGGRSWRDTTLNTPIYKSPTGVKVRYGLQGYWELARPGEAWQTLAVTYYYQPFFGNGDALYFLYDTVLTRTNNFGVTWLTRALPFRVGYRPQLCGDAMGGLYLIPELGSGILWYSSDEGATWNRYANMQYTQTMVATPAGRVIAYRTPGVYDITGGEVKELSMTIALYGLQSVFTASNGDLVGLAYQSPTFRIVRSKDDGLDWTLEDVDTSLYHAFSDVVESGSTLYGITNHYESGAYRYSLSRQGSDGKWSYLNIFPKDTSVSRLIVLGDVVVVASYPSGILRSTDGGSNFVESNNGITNGSIYAMRRDNFGRIIIGTANGVFISHDDGANWKRSDIRYPNPNVNEIAVDRSGRIYAGTVAGLFKSDDEINWDRVYIGLQDFDVRALCLDSAGNLYASYSSLAWLYSSTDRGQNWRRIPDFVNLGNTYKTINSISTDRKGFVYVSSSIGLFRSTTSPFVSSVYASDESSAGGLWWNADHLELASRAESGAYDLSLYDVTGRSLASLKGNASVINDNLRRLSLPRSSVILYTLSTNGSANAGKVLTP